MLFQTQDPKLQDAGSAPGPGSAPAGAILSEDTRRGDDAARIPPRQARTRKWPVLDTGVHPTDKELNLKIWRFTIGGLAENPHSFDWEAWQKLPRVQVFGDMHCVTRWSRLGNLWEGVSTREILRRVPPTPDAKFVMVSAYDKVSFFKGGHAVWTTNLPLSYFDDEDCLFADTHDGAPIAREHGGPVRLVVPKLYAWKSAKWVAGIEYRADDAPGYWERGGYHMLGDPWKEQRFRFSEDGDDAADDSANAI